MAMHNNNVPLTVTTRDYTWTCRSSIYRFFRQAKGGVCAFLTVTNTLGNNPPISSFVFLRYCTYITYRRKANNAAILRFSETSSAVSETTSSCRHVVRCEFTRHYLCACSASFRNRKLLQIIYAFGSAHEQRDV